MTDNPAISIVVPTLNDESTIGAMLESLANQTYQNFEVIIIDDGSTDGTLDIVRNWTDALRSVNVIERPDKQGIPSALNRSIEAARGEYIARHDADDYSDVDRLLRQFEYLETHPEVALVGTGAYHIESDGAIRSRRRVREEPPEELYREKTPFIHGSVMMRADAVRSIGGYDESLPSSEDRDLWVRMQSDYELRNIDAPLYYLRLSEESAYASQLYTSKLYGQYVALRELTDRVDTEREAAVKRNGTDAIEHLLTDEEMLDIKLSIGQELLRWGKQRESRRYILEVLQQRPLNVMTMGVLALTFMPTKASLGAINLYRKRMNRQIAKTNSTSGDI